MWTHNSERNLHKVLKRIEEVIPERAINRKIITDDHSTDKTRKIADELDWEVHSNKGKGLKDNVATAVNLVSSPYFCSFEHDIMLVSNWWTKMSKHIKDPTVAVAQGVRSSTNQSFRVIDNFYNNRKDVSHESLDNNLVKTDIVRQLGYNEVGTPPKLKKDNLKWIVDQNVVSGHIRDSMWDNARHDYTMSSVFPSSWKKNLEILLKSPARSAHLAYRSNSPTVLVAYPVDRLGIFVASLKSKRRSGPI
jgi:glycosyltransferase involved in cell wall biosynthesis